MFHGDNLCTLPAWEELVKYWNERIITEPIYSSDETGVTFPLLLEFIKLIRINEINKNITNIDLITNNIHKINKWNRLKLFSKIMYLKKFNKINFV